MIYPSVEELTKNNNCNRYTLVIVTAKCARMVTDEYVEQREIAEKLLANKETDKSLTSMIKKEIRDEKAVKTAIKRLNKGEYRILSEEVVAEREAKEAQRRAELEAAIKDSVSPDFASVMAITEEGSDD